MKKSYEDLVKIFQDNNCELTTTKEEFDLLNGRLSASIFSFKASCGHDNTVTLTNFVQKGSGVICKKCMKSQVSAKLKEFNQDNDKPASKCLVQESDVFKKFNNLLSNELDIIKTHEGCTADFIIKPKNIQEDKWLGIQLKTTQGICHDLYSFILHDGHSKYENMIILCHCIADNSSWLIPYDKVSHIKSKLNIGLTERSVYSKFKVKLNKISEVLINYYFITKLDISEIFMIPKNIYQQQEIKYRKLREEYCNFLEFKYPDIEQCYYDFTVNNKQIQEKVTWKKPNRKDSYIAALFRNTSNNKRKNYLLGMNDYYWIHIPDSDIFYILPESELYKNGFIKDPNKEESEYKMFLNLSINFSDGWYNDYKYNYKNLDKEFISKIFE